MAANISFTTNCDATTCGALGVSVPGLAGPDIYIVKVEELYPDDRGSMFLRRNGNFHRDYSDSHPADSNFLVVLDLDI
jgi:hypothetical protein